MPLVDVVLRASVILALGLAASALLRRQSAALRHRVIAGALLAAGLVMPATLLMPAWHVPVPSRSAESGHAPAAAGSIDVVTAPTVQASPPTPATVSAAHLAVATWAAGALIMNALLAAGLVRARRVASRSIPILEGPWISTRDAIAARYRLPRDVAIARTDSATFLATWGVRRPQVLVPRDACDWSLERVRVVLGHELAHVRRHDWIVQIAADLLRALLWFNPLAWMACARLRRESELACDDEVLADGVASGVYAKHLLDLARQSRRPRVLWASAVPMAHPSTLHRRIAAMLNPRIDRRTPSRRMLATLSGVLLLVTLSVAAVRAGQAGPAALAGTVYDVSGGVMPGVEVALIDASQAKRTATSNASGRFEILNVAPGAYVIEAKVPGFGALRQEVELRAPHDWNRAITLQIGRLSESISVRAVRAPAAAAPAPRTDSPRAPVRVGGNVRAPRKTHDVKPVFPPAMREAGLTGVVSMEAVIGTDGTVSAVRVLSTQAHPDFAIAAAEAVRQWRFTPTLLNGAPVEVMMTVTVRFDLEG